MRKVIMYCDRCKKEFEKWNHKYGIAEFVHDDSAPYLAPYLDEPKDLCESCYTEFENWWNITPQAEQRWIPVSERMPEDGSEVLVCYDFKGKRNVYIADFYGDGDFHGLDDEYLTPEGRKYRKAVAWMPLPKPYQKG